MMMIDPTRESGDDRSLTGFESVDNNLGGLGDGAPSSMVPKSLLLRPRHTENAAMKPEWVWARIPLVCSVSSLEIGAKTAEISKNL